MPILYKFVTAVLALTGCISLLLTGGVNPLMTIGGLAMLPGYYRFLKGATPAPKWAIGTFSLLTLGVFFADSLVISGDVFLAVAHLTIVFQAIKSFDLREPWDHLQVYFMALLQLIIASDLTRSLTFGFVFVIFMGLLVTAMVLSHFLKEGALGRISIRKPVFLISLLTLFVTVLIFVLVPRTTHKFFGRSHAKAIRTIGFSEKVDFGSYGEVKLDPTVVMRVEMDKAVPSLYWRGMALDYFDGNSWRITRDAKYRIDRSAGGGLVEECEQWRTVAQRIYLEPIDSDVVFGLPRICSVSSEEYPLYADYGNGIYMRGKSSRRVKYTIHSMTGGGYGGTRENRYLQLPAGAERIKDLAGRVTQGTTSDERRAFMIERYLKNNYSYSLETSRPPAGVSPVEDFLFNSKKGYCEHYATSMVMMLRSVGIPSRIVAGYYGGEKNEYGGYIIVRQSNAHSWVEVLIRGRWERFDPTPEAPVTPLSTLALFIDSLQLNWSRYVVGFSSADQREIVKGLSMPFRLKRLPAYTRPDFEMLLYVAVLAALLSLAVYLFFQKLRIRKYGFVTEKYLAFKRVMRKRGIRMKQSMTAGEVKQKALHLGISADIEDFLRIYEEHRFGQRVLSPEDRGRYIRLLKKIKKGHGHICPK